MIPEIVKSYLFGEKYSIHVGEPTEQNYFGPKPKKVNEIVLGDAPNGPKGAHPSLPEQL